MPNWCYNEMTISSECDKGQQQLQKFKEKSIVKDGLTFEGVVPRPKSLDITSGGKIDDGIAYLKSKDGDISDIKKMTERKWTYEGKTALYAKDTHIKEKIHIMEKHLEDELEVNDLTEARMALENIEKHGHKDWYNWSIEKWGTKWDAATNDYDYDDDWIRISFDTAWSPPQAWLHAVTKEYPLLDILVRITEESDAYMGYICCRDGMMRESFASPDYP